MEKSSRIIFIAFLVFVIFVVNPSVMAAEVEDGKNWQFNLAPFYLWAFTMDGNLTSGIATVPVQIPVSDMVDNLEAAFIVHFEGMHKNKWGLKT